MRTRFAVLATTILVVAACAPGASPTPDLTNALVTTNATAPPASPVHPRCIPDPEVVRPSAAGAVPVELQEALAGRFGDARLTSNRFGVSIWIEGMGEVATHDPDLPLFPASNQKLLTAMGVLDVLGPDARLRTSVLRTTTDDLVVVGAGDPSLTSSGPHSLETLAADVRAAGITTVHGTLIVDESRHDGLRRAAGWQDWQVPAYAGPLSAFMVDSNRYRSDAAFLADPALANAEQFRGVLAAHGVQVMGPVVTGVAPDDADRIATVSSLPVGALLQELLLTSDNMAAETLLKEVGRAGGDAGSTLGGLAATRRALESRCIPVTGTDDDGSGLSRANGRSARAWRQLLHGAMTAPWFGLLFDSLPVAGRSGTLAGRFRGTAAEGVVQAKTGTIIGGIALSGYGTTAGGRRFVFSIVVNGDSAHTALPVVDAIVADVADSGS